MQILKERSEEHEQRFALLLKLKKASQMKLWFECFASMLYPNMKDSLALKF